MWQIDYYQYFLDTVLSVFLLYHIKCFVTVADHTVVHQTLHFCVCLCLLGHRWLKLLFHPSVNWNTDFYKSQSKNSQCRLLLNILIVLLWKRSECSLKEISLYWAKQKLCSVWDAGTADESSKQACGADATFKEKCISSIRLWRYKVMKTFSLLENERHVLAKRQSKVQILHMIFCLTESCWNPSHCPILVPLW